MRECVLAGFPESHAKILREIGPALYTIYLEEYAYRFHEYCGSSVKSSLRAVVQDLRYTVWYLAVTAQSGADSSRESDEKLGLFADRLAVHLAKIAAQIEQRIVPRRKEKAGEDVA
jgi:hypothetical protein